MNVLLVSANRLKNPYAVYPLGLDYVVRALDDHHQVQVMDLNAEAGTEALADVLQDTSPDIVGISIRNIDNTDTLDPRGFTGQYRDLAALIRSHTTAPIVLGGSGFTIFPAELMALLQADYGIIGEGERLAGLSLRPGRADVAVEVTVGEPGAERSVSYLPRGEALPGQAVRLLEGCCERDPEEAVFRRNLAVARLCPDRPELLDLGEEEVRETVRRARAADVRQLDLLFALAGNGVIREKQHKQAQHDLDNRCQIERQEHREQGILRPLFFCYCRCVVERDIGRRSQPFLTALAHNRQG